MPKYKVGDIILQTSRDRTFDNQLYQVLSISKNLSMYELIVLDSELINNSVFYAGSFYNIDIEFMDSLPYFELAFDSSNICNSKTQKIMLCICLTCDLMIRGCTCGGF